MNPQHFLEHVFLKKNKKGHYRVASFRRAKNPSQGPQHVFCRHCGARQTISRRIVVSGFTCTPCREHERLAGLAAR